MLRLTLPAALGFAVLAAYGGTAWADDVHPVVDTVDIGRSDSSSFLTDTMAVPMVGSTASFSLFVQDQDGRELAVGVGGLAAHHVGAGALQLSQGPLLAPVAALANPYVTLVPDALHVTFAQQVGEVKLRIGMSTSTFPLALASQHGTLPSFTTPAEGTSGLVEISKSFGTAALSASLSQTRESDTYLGSSTRGLLSLFPGASTRAFQLTGAVMLAPKLALAGQAAYGVTLGSDNQNIEVATTRSNAFSLALVAADRLKRGDSFSVSLSQPLRAYSGRFSMDVLSHSRGSGSLRERLVLTMVPLGRAMRLQLSYQAPAGQGANFGASLIVRRNRNNVEDVALERLLVLRYLKQF